MRIHINHLILLEEKFGVFDVGATSTYPEHSDGPVSSLYLRFGYWLQKPAENIQSMLRKLTLNVHLTVVERIYEDDDVGDRYLYEVYHEPQFTNQNNNKS